MVAVEDEPERQCDSVAEIARKPRAIITDRLKSYPGVLREMKRGRALGFTQHRRGRWLNDLVEQEHRRTTEITVSPERCVTKGKPNTLLSPTIRELQGGQASL